MKKTILIFLAMCLCWQTAQARDKINISYVKSPFNLQSIVMKNMGFLDKELEPLGLKPVWHEINSGAQQAQAMAAGSLDVSTAMNTTSVQLARSEGNPIKIVAAVSRPVDIFAIVGAKDGPADVTDLRGKIVAGPKGTVLHQLLSAALAKNNLNIKDVKFVQMDIPKAFAALESGQADAALLAANALIKANEAGHKTLATARGIVTPKLGLVATENFINSQPEALKAIIRAHDKAWAWIKDNHQEAIALGAKEQEISLEDAENLFQRSHFIQRFTPKDLQSMDEDMQFMLKNGMMRREINSRDIILPGAME